MWAMRTGLSSVNTAITCWGTYTSTWVVPAPLGRSGLIVRLSCIRCHMSSVTLPVASARGVPRTSFSNAQIACCVFGPYAPSIGPGSKPRSLSRCWTIVTSAGAAPFLIVAVRWVFGTAGSVCSTTAGIVVDVAAGSTAREVLVIAAEPSEAASEWSLRPASPMPTTSARTATAAAAGSQRRRFSPFTTYPRARSLPVIDRLEAAQFLPQGEHLAKDRADDRERGERALAPGAREVVHSELDDLVAELAGPDDQFGVDERALAAQFDVLEDLAPAQLEGEVDVAHPHPEQAADEHVVEERVHRPRRTLAGPVEAVGRHDVGVVVAHQPDRLADLGHVERQIGVAVQHQVARGRGEAGLHRPTELAVPRVVDGDDVRVGRGELVGDPAGGVGRGIVDDDHLVVQDLAAPRQRLALDDRRIDGPADVVLFVPHRQEDAQLLEGIAGRHPQQGSGLHPARDCG